MKRHAFTLIEMAMALAAGAIILVAVYGVFSKAIHLRDDATERTREMRARMRVASVIRNDLRNALVSGGTLAASLTTTADRQAGSFPGYLEFTTTTARESSTDEASSDVQRVEFYIADDTAATDRKTGILMRAVDHNILAPTRETPAEEPLVTGVESMEVAFYDGQSWAETWEVTADDKTLPEAVRVTIRLSPSAHGYARAPIEVLMPWPTQPGIETPPTDAGGTTPPQ